MGVGVRPLAEQGPTKVVSPCKLLVKFLFISILLLSLSLLQDRWVVSPA